MQQVAQALIKTPTQSARKIKWEFDISDHSLQWIMKDFGLKVYKPYLLQELMEDDPERCAIFIRGNNV